MNPESTKSWFKDWLECSTIYLFPMEFSFSKTSKHLPNKETRSLCTIRWKKSSIHWMERYDPEKKYDRFSPRWLPFSLKSPPLLWKFTMLILYSMVCLRDRGRKFPTPRYFRDYNDNMALDIYDPMVWWVCARRGEMANSGPSTRAAVRFKYQSGLSTVYLYNVYSSNAI